MTSSSDFDWRHPFLDENIKSVTLIEFGQRIRSLRGERGVEALVEGTGIDPSTWSRYENGKGGWPKTNTLLLIAKALQVPPGAILNDEPDQAPSEDPRLAELRALFAQAAVVLGEGQKATPRGTPYREELGMKARGVAAGGPEGTLGPGRERQGLRLLPYEPESSADEPREIHDTEVPVVAYAAAGSGEVELIETGETALVNNTIARRVQSGKGFVAKVSGESMEDRLSNGDLVYFQHATAETVPDGAIVYVLYEGKSMVKIIRFAQEREGKRKDWRLVSHNKNRKKYPTIHLLRDFRVMGWAQERVDKGLGAERFRDLEE